MADYIDRDVAEKALIQRCDETGYGGLTKHDVELVMRTPWRIPSADVIERDAFTIYGYSVKELLAFALACREQDVTDRDLKNFCYNLDFAYEAINKRQEKIFNEYLSKFCTDKIKIEPEALKGEDDG